MSPRPWARRRGSVVVIERIPKAVEEFVDQQIADLERFRHGAGRNLERPRERNEVRTRARATAQMSASAYSLSSCETLDERKLFIHKEGAH